MPDKVTYPFSYPAEIKKLKRKHHPEIFYLHRNDALQHKILSMIS